MTATPKQLAHAFLAVSETCEEKELEEVSKQFVAYLQSQHLLGKARAILDALHQAWKERYGISQIKITTAHPLSKKSLQALEKAARGASVETTVDASLIGGATLRIDDRILDGSLSGQLASLKQTLLET
jgi:F-type H+-transporting ATPase subunit delta